MSARSGLLVACAVFAALSTWMNFASTGFLEADGCTHYLYARFAFEEPHYFVNVWGRPFKTLLYAPAVWLGGLHGARMLSLALALGVVWVAGRIARNSGACRAELAGLMVLVQPLLFLHSFSELTELPFALLLGLVFVAGQERRWWWFALLAGWLPLARPEGFGFVLAAMVVLLLYRRWVQLLVVPLPLVFWNVVGKWVTGFDGPWWAWLGAYWPYAGTSLYPPGNPLHFVGLLPVVVGPIFVPALICGGWLVVRESRCALRGPEGGWKLAIPGIPLGILMVHTTLYTLGKMASSGEVRYLLTAAPFWGVLAGAGWEWVFRRLNWKGEMAWAGGLGLLVPVVVNASYQVLPLVMFDDWQQARKLAAWYRDSGWMVSHPKLAASHPGVFLELDRSPTAGSVVVWERDKLEKSLPGTVVIWDRIYGVSNSDARRKVELNLLRAGGWVEITDAPVPTDGSWAILAGPSAEAGSK